jgi:malonate transporter and related proteins
MLLSLLSITAPIYLCIAVGYACVRQGVFTKADLRVLGQFVLQLALPAMLFNALATRPLGEVLHPGYVLAYACGSLVLLVLALWCSVRIAKKSLTESAYIAMGMSCSNSGYVGYPVMLLAFGGPLAGVILALNVLIENVLKLPLLFSLADAGAGAVGGQRLSWPQVVRQTAHRLVRMPMLIAIAVGVVVSALGIPMPDVLKRTIGLFGGATSGVALFIIGGNLVGLSLTGLRQQVSWITMGKLVLHPLLVFAAIALLPLLGLPAVTGELRAAAILSAAMPMLGIYSLLAQRHGHEGFTAAALLTTTVGSFISLNVVLAVLGVVPD